MVAASASPLVAPVEVVERRPDGLDASLLVDATEPVLEGHFPGFPIFPGVCLVECAHQACLHALPAGAALATIVSTRFLAAVFPGDEVLIAVEATDEGAAWHCTARLRARRGDGAEADVALVRLRYSTPEGGHGRR